MEEQDIGELFLINFMHSLATISPFKEVANISNDEEMQESLLKPEMKKPIQMVPAFLRPVPIKKSQLYEIKAPQNKNIIQNQIYKTETEKLNTLIKDPFVNEIECIGADNPLLVKIRGITQKTQVKLTIEEIYDLIAEFSQKTKIPVLNGSIKAALNNLIITAVLSETLGPRFILQKKKPFQQLI